MAKLTVNLVKQVGEPSIEVDNESNPIALSLVDTEVVSLSANLKRAREEVASARADLELRAVAELDTKKHIVALSRVRDIWPDEVGARKETILRSEETFAMGREKTSFEVREWRSDYERAVTCNQKHLASTRRVAKACD